MSALARVVEALEPSLREHAVSQPPAGELESGLDDAEHAFVIEAVREGYLLHHGDPRTLKGMDADLRLLAGDALYALGLERLAQLGDLEAVAELADLISLCAWAHAESRAEVVPALWGASVEVLAGRGGRGARHAAAQIATPAG